MKSKILILVNHDVVIYNFRKELVKALLDNNMEVYICSPWGERIDKLTDMGAIYINLEMNRHGKNPIEDYKLYKSYKKIMKKVKPDVILTYTIKPNIYGGMAAKSLKIPYIANITGLGIAVENESLIQKIINKLYKKAFEKIDKVYFQNQSNLNYFIKNKIAMGKHELLPGSGVNLDNFTSLEYPENNVVVITYLGRIMKDKGMSEFLDAIVIISKLDLNVNFKIVGSYEDKAYKDKISELETMGILEYVGQVNDVKPIVYNSHAIINPSYHEGLSNILLEASACARPVLASRVPGCIETFDEGITGLGFESKNVNSLVEIIIKFVSLTNKEREQMGINARLKVEKEFDRNIVVKKYLKEIDSILKEKKNESL